MNKYIPLAAALLVLVALLVSLPAVSINSQPAEQNLAAAGGNSPANEDVDQEMDQDVDESSQRLSGKELNDKILKAAKQPEADKDEIKKLIVRRKMLMRQLAKDNPAAFLQLAFRRDEKNTLPDEVKANVETEVTIDNATLEVLHIDDLKNQKDFRFEYFLNKNGRRLAFYPTIPLSLRSGAKVKVTGVQLDEAVVAYTGGQDNPIVLADAPAPDAVGEQKMLVIPIRWSGSINDSTSLTRSQISDLVFRGQFQNFIREESYGKAFFSGDVLDWVTFTGQEPNDCTGWADLNNQIIQGAILQSGLNLANYGRILYFGHGWCSMVGRIDQELNGQPYRLSESWVSSAGYNSNSVFDRPFPWTALDYLLAHELGHALGLMHANGWDCGNQINHGVCYHLEYGNRFDTMGGGASFHYNAFYKKLLGWLTPSEVLKISSSGRYIINPLESAGSQTKLAEITLANQTQPSWFVEYRRAIGFDRNLDDPEVASNQEGLMVNLIQQDRVPTSRILDMQPTDQEFYNDLTRSSLNVGQIFADPSIGLTLGPVIGSDVASSTFNVSIVPPGCTRMAPAISLPLTYGEPDIIVAAGGSWGFPRGIGISNEDYLGCADSNFSVSVQLPSGWSYYVSDNINLAPAELGNLYSYIEVPASTAVGTYNATITVRNLTSGLSSSKPIRIQVLPPPVINSFNPSYAPVGATFTINGSGFATFRENIVILYNSTGNYVSATSIFTADPTKLSFVVPVSVTTCSSTCQEIPTSDGLYNIVVFANGVDSNTKTFYVGSTPPPPPTADIKVNGSNGPVIVPYSSTVTLTWTSSNATSCTASNGWSGARLTSGTESAGPLITAKTFTLTCSGPGGNPYADSVVVNLAPPVVNIKANNSDGPIIIPYNTAATLSWTSTNATSCTASGAWTGTKPLSGNQSTGPLTANRYYTLVCTGPGGTRSDSVAVAVQQTPSASLTVVSPNGGETYRVGNTVTLRWSSTGLTSTDKVSLSLYNQPTPTSGRYAYIITNIPNTGSYIWTIPATIRYIGQSTDAPTPGTYKLMVQSNLTQNTRGLSFNDLSNATFTIGP